MFSTVKFILSYVTPALSPTLYFLWFPLVHHRPIYFYVSSSSFLP